MSHKIALLSHQSYWWPDAPRDLLLYSSPRELCNKFLKRNQIRILYQLSSKTNSFSWDTWARRRWTSIRCKLADRPPTALRVPHCPPPAVHCPLCPLRRSPTHQECPSLSMSRFPSGSLPSSTQARGLPSAPLFPISLLVGSTTCRRNCMSSLFLVCPRFFPSTPIQSLLHCSCQGHSGICITKSKEGFLGLFPWNYQKRRHCWNLSAVFFWSGVWDPISHNFPPLSLVTPSFVYVYFPCAPLTS